MDRATNPTENVTALHDGLDALLVEVTGLANRLKSSNPSDIIPAASLAALLVLQRSGPQTVPQIAQARCSSRQNIQILMNRLQQEGLVEFASNPGHKRSALVRLTEHGQSIVSTAAQEDTEFTTKFLPTFSRMELSSATEVLSKLRKLLGGKANHTDETNGGTVRQKANATSSKMSNESHEISDEATATGSAAEENELAEGELPVNLL